jgi:2,5-diketo-D-gluconate reductase B
MLHQTIQGEDVPALGLGTYQLKGNTCREAVHHALDLGYRHVDTAEMYGNEEAVGQGLQDAATDRAAIFLTTKVWHTHLAPDDVRAAVDASLRKLQTDYVDLLLIHWPNASVPLEATLDAFLDVQDAGKTRHIGVSNFPPTLFRRALDRAPIFCNQVEYHPFLGQQALLEIAREHDVLLTAYSPLAQGDVLRRDVSPRRALKALRRNGSPSTRIVKAAKNLLGTGPSVLKSLGEKYGKSPAQISLRWLVQQDHVAAIPKAASAAHRASNLDVFDFALTEAEMQLVHGLAQGDRHVDPHFAPDWNM